MRLIGLLTTYEDADWLPQTLKSFEQLDGGVIIEGAYQETIKLGKPPRSQDGTIDLCKHFVNYMFGGCDTGEDPLFIYDETNQESDVQQRNYALSLLRKRFPGNDVVAMIIDGDEEYTSSQISEIKNWANWLIASGRFISGILWSQVYISDNKYILHAFPRLFRITPGCRFIDSNLMYWPEYNYTAKFPDQEEGRAKLFPYSLATTHHSYQRNKERFEWKKSGRVARRGSFPWEWDKQLNRPDREGMIYIERDA